MALVFHYGSGSPYAWRVWFGLEHKGLPYEFRLVSFSNRDHKTPDFLAKNPRGRVPLLEHDGFAIYESHAILTYLDAAFGDTPRLFPGGAQELATVHRIVHEVDNYLTEPYEAIIQQLFRRKPDAVDAAELAKACDAFVAELVAFERMLGGRPFFAMVPSAADFALYPIVAFVQRFERVKPDLGLSARVPAGILAWQERMKALPYHDKCWPPHWRG